MRREGAMGTALAAWPRYSPLSSSPGGAYGRRERVQGAQPGLRPTRSSPTDSPPTVASPWGPMLAG